MSTEESLSPLLASGFSHSDGVRVYHATKGLDHKKLTDWARQALLQCRRWLPGRRIIAVADNAYSSLGLIAALRDDICLITRLRLDANLFDLPAPRRQGTMGRPALKGKKQKKLGQRLTDPETVWTKLRCSQWYGGTAKELEVLSGVSLWYKSGIPPQLIRWVLVRDPSGSLEPQAFLCTDIDEDPAQILAYFVRRWQMEVTFEESRAHLGIETQRQWSDQAIARTTPALLGLFSLTTLWATSLAAIKDLPRQAAWYQKQTPTFIDALALVRRSLWLPDNFNTSTNESHVAEVPGELFKRLIETACYAP